MSLVKPISLPLNGDDRGSLIAIEEESTIPFSIKRVYYIFGTLPGISRGFHAHKKLHQVAVCVSGKCRMVLDNGNLRESVWLDNPSVGILIDSFIWREMHDFSSDCVLLVFASEHYDESDYIREYDEFLQQARA